MSHSEPSIREDVLSSDDAGTTPGSWHRARR